MIEYIYLIWTHFLADFILQTDKVAINKSKSNAILLQHVLIYALPFSLLGFFIKTSPEWLLFNMVAHFITDYFTSRTCSYLWKNEQRHWFFVVIGLDQAIHMTCLMLSYGRI